MKLVIKILPFHIFFFVVCFVVGCGSMERAAEVKMVGVKQTVESKKIQKAQELVTKAKLNFQIALLKLRLGQADELKGFDSIFVQASSFQLAGQPESKLEGFENEMTFSRVVSEFYDLTELAAKKGLKLVILCSKRKYCLQLSKNFEASKIDSHEIIGPERLNFVRFYRPLFIIGHNEEFLTQLADKLPIDLAQKWESSWVQFTPLSQAKLDLNEWSKLELSIKEF